jgi:hypothetical protein
MNHLPLFDIAGALVFAIWLVLSVFNQLKVSLNDRVRRWDVGHLVPRWTFFAPNPGTADYHLVYRDFDAASQPCSPWHEVHMPLRSRLSLIWNPQKRARKVLVDMAQSLSSLAVDNNAAATFSIPYLALLQLTLHHSQPAANAHARQFGIAQTYGPEQDSEPVFLYRSATHPFHSAPSAITAPAPHLATPEPAL